MEGQVYVTVEANEASPMLMSAVQSGKMGDAWFGTYNLHWDSEGGVQGNGFPPGFSSTSTSEDTISGELAFFIRTNYPDYDDNGVNHRVEYMNSVGNCAIAYAFM